MRYCTGVLAVAALALAGCSHVRPPGGVAARRDSVVTTGYCKCESCCGWTRNWLGRPVFAYGPSRGKVKRVGVTSNGSHARVGTIAADTGVFPFGTIIYVPGYGYGKVEDRGGDIKGKHIDLYFRSHGQAQEWGRRVKDIKIWPPGEANGVIKAGL
ncbi:MAG: 3D domain-containing protein [Verrucomicrobia bacterium]|nr:3D domain-containing protein [Verrucomicrobiota bacterium]MDA1085563.1 3D domain-containing protein [Verrucomicrobiota bacterium]